MAGIAGVEGGNTYALATMLVSLRHRDSHEIWTSPAEYRKIGCCKLKSESTQQCQLNRHANGKFAILNGDLYNYSATSRGFTGATLLLSLYEQFWLQFAERLDGDFSRALLDSGELILTRDTTSVKPLYYDYKGGEFCFASEAKTVTEIAQEVKEFPPGYIYIPKLGFQRFTPSEITGCVLSGKEWMSFLPDTKANEKSKEKCWKPGNL